MAPINVTTSKQQITASVAEDKISATVSGGFGATGPSGVINVTAPITNAGTTTAANVGLSVGSGLSVSGGSLVVTPDTYATLVGGKVPAEQLPSYVDDVLEYANLASLPGTGESGKIYVALNTGKIYRWSGSAYFEISTQPGNTDAVPEGSSNLYFTNARARNAFGSGTDGQVITWSGGQWTAGAAYTLPTATASVLGGVKIGSGISIDGNGVISASSGYTLPTATNSVLGGVKIGSGVTITDGVISVSTNYAAANHTHVAGDIAATIDAWALFHFDGNNGDTTFVNSSATTLSVTASGDAQISTAQSQIGGASLYLDGTGDYLTVNDGVRAVNFGVAGEPYTIEGWFYAQGSGSRVLWCANGGAASWTASDGLQHEAFINSDDDLVVIVRASGGGDSQVASVAMAQGEWVHVAVTYDGTTARVFVNGTLGGSLAVAHGAAAGDDRLDIGSEIGSAVYQGYIDEFRIVRGACLYTSAFTPSLAALPARVTGTLQPALDAMALASHKHTAAGITFAATDRLLGRSSSGAGAGQEIVCTSAGRALLDDADAAAQRTTLGLGTAAAADIGTGSTQVAAGDHTHAQLHDRSHAITSTSDHTATAWRVFYSNGSGVVTELALGASGTVLTSGGTSAAPSFTALAASATTDTTNASNISSGTLAAARIGTHASTHQTGGSDAITNVVVSPSQITGNQNDYSPGTGDIVRLSSDAARNITGITAGTSGEVRVLVNVGSNTITLVHQSASSTAGNRFLVSFGSDYLIAANAAAVIVYDGTTSRWRVI